MKGLRFIRSDRFRRGLRIAVSLLPVTGFPPAVCQVIRSLDLILPGMALSLILWLPALLLYSGVTRGRGVLKFLRWAGPLAAALMLLAGMNITPASAFEAWRELLPLRRGGGSMAVLVLLFSVLVSSQSGAAVLHRKPAAALLTAGALHALLFYLLFSRTEALVLMIAALALLPAVSFSRGSGVQEGVRLLIMGMILLAGLLFSRGFLSLFPDARLPGGGGGPDLTPAVSRIFPRFPFLFNQPGYGSRYGGGDFFRPPFLSSAGLYRLDGAPPGRLYLREEVYTRFTGREWLKGSRNLREVPAVSRQIPGLREDPGSPAEAGSRGITLTVLTDLLSLIPEIPGYWPEAFFVPEKEAAGSRELYPLDGSWQVRPALTAGEAVGYRSGPDGPGAGRGDGGEEAGGGREAGVPGDSGTDPELTEASGVSGEIRRAAGELADSRGDPAKTAENIRNFLSRGFRYSLAIRENPRRGETETPMERFFRERSGFCVHYATAAAELARLNGIPARFVTGYAVSIGSGGAAVVTGKQAHAWAEILLPGEGWSVLETTPAVPEGSPVPEPAEGASSRPAAGTVPAEKGQNQPVFLPPVLLLLGAGGGIFFLFRIRRLGKPENRLLRQARRLAAEGIRAGAPPPETSGWSPFLEVLEQGAGRPGEFRLVRKILLEFFYGGAEPRRRDGIYLRLVTRRVRRRRISSPARRSSRVPGGDPERNRRP